MAPSLRVAFCHPDLGLGGAERLIVDAATELAAKKTRVASVDVWTAHYDRSRSFEETRGSGGFDVRVAGGWFPRSVGGRAMALCAYLRCCLVALAIAWSCWFGRGYEVVIVDQVRRKQNLPLHRFHVLALSLCTSLHPPCPSLSCPACDLVGSFTVDADTVSSLPLCS